MPCEACPCPDICLAAKSPRYRAFCGWAASGDEALARAVCLRSLAGEAQELPKAGVAPGISPGETSESPSEAILFLSVVGRGAAVPDIPLAGDLVEAIAKRIGADRLARLWEQWTGLPCGCEERKAKLNAATEKLLKWARWLGLV
jgi:hypothetical protein